MAAPIPTTPSARSCFPLNLEESQKFATADEVLAQIRRLSMAEREHVEAELMRDAYVVIFVETETMRARVQGEYETKLNALLGTPSGKAYVAWQAADNVEFAKVLMFSSAEGIPAVLRLRQFAEPFMGALSRGGPPTYLGTARSVAFDEPHRRGAGS